MVGSVGSRSLHPPHLPDIMRRWERETGKCGLTDKGLRDIVALDCVRFLNIQDVEFITYPSLKRDDGLSINMIRF